MKCFKRFRNIDSHFASKQILKVFERSNHRRVNNRPMISKSFPGFRVFFIQISHYPQIVLGWLTALTI